MVQVAVNSLPNNVSFVSSKKESVVIPGKNGDGKFSTGTKIIIWLKFMSAGEYSISPVDLRIADMQYKLPFENIKVLANPRFIKPEVSVEFKKSISEIHEGDHVEFIVSVKYAAGIRDVYWEIPIDSIFRKVQSFDLSAYNMNPVFTTKEIPVASFDWQPLKSGTYSFPEIFIKVDTFEGTSTELKCINDSFNIKPSTKKNTVKERMNHYAEAFSKIEDDEKYEELKSYEIIQLVEFYEKERMSIPWISESSRNRRNLEAEFGLSQDSASPSIPLFVLMASAAAVFMILMIIQSCMKRKTQSFLCFVMFVMLSVFSSIYGYKLSVKKGVYRGGSLNPIPEISVSSGVRVPSGSLVTIENEAGEWMYIRHGNTYGWVLEKNIVPLRNIIKK